jgi:catechol 2,3-dioxygenase-like lactoylglutathione lyase family enzyme
MAQHLHAVAFLVREYDEAIAFFTQALRFRLLEDKPLTPEKRWVRVAPRGADSESACALLLARAATPQQQAAIGQHAGGRVGWFLHTEDFDGDIAHMQAQGVRFTESPRQEAYGRVVVFLDLYGNRWDLIEARPKATSNRI